MVDPLVHDFASLTHGDHVCLPYDDGDECGAVIVPFIADGLARGERCIYVVEDADRDQFLRRLSDAGVNASRALYRGALCTLTPDELYFREGRGSFDPDETFILIDGLLASALADGFTGVRGSGEVTSRLRADIPWPTMLAYEARFNERFARRPVVALCRYRRGEWPAGVVADVLRTHPTAIVGRRMCRNPYYERPDLALASDRDGARVEWMLHQLRREAAIDQRAQDMTRSLADETARLSAAARSSADAQEDLARAVRLRDRFLDDLAKALTGPIGGLAAELERPARSDELGALRGHLKRLGTVIEELQEVSRITNRGARACGQEEQKEEQEIDLCDVARQVAMRSRDRLLAVGSPLSFRAPETRVEPCIRGRWDRRRLEQLIANMLTNAGKRGAGHPIELAIGGEPGTASVSVRHHGCRDAAATGDGDEIAAFGHGGRAASDQASDHMSSPHSPLAGTGLWVAREIAGGFGGTLSVAVSRDGGLTTTITVELPRATAPKNPR